VAFGWLALFGWAAHRARHAHAHSPFLVVPPPALVAPHQRADVPVLPDSMQRVGLAFHATTLLVGCAALLSGLPLLARATGAGLVLTGISLLSSIVRVLAHARPVTAQSNLAATT
jgi:hypothetical protein